MRNKYEVQDKVVLIYLNEGYIARISVEDFEKVNSFPYTWYRRMSRNKKTVYVSGNIFIDERKRKQIHLHRWITDCPDNLEVDHINGDGLDNTQPNLRCVPLEHNRQNRTVNPSSATGERNIRFSRSGTYEIRFRVEGKNKYFGAYKTLEEAIEERDKIRKKLRPYSEDR